MGNRPFSDEVELRGEVMPHALGQWPGPRPMEWTMRHKHTGFKVVWNEATWQRQRQHKMREAALIALEMMVEALDG
jgi:hypothetical protein